MISTTNTTTETDALTSRIRRHIAKSSLFDRCDIFRARKSIDKAKGAARMNLHLRENMLRACIETGVESRSVGMYLCDDRVYQLKIDVFIYEAELIFTW